MWVSRIDLIERGKLIQMGCLVPLISIERNVAAPNEHRRLARLSLSKLLLALGDELTTRITLIELQLRGTKHDDLWMELTHMMK